MIALSKALGPVALDVTVREVHESDLRITRHPVEFGADVSDHAIIEPKRLTLDAVTGSRPGGPAAIAASFQALTRLQESREPIAVVTALSLYRNMLIERVTVDRDRMNGRVLAFRAELREVVIVDTETASGKLAAGRLQEGDARDRGAPTVQRGNTATRPAPIAPTPAPDGTVGGGGITPTLPADEAGRNTSLARRVFGGG